MKIFIIILFLLPLFCFAQLNESQKHQIDSIRNVIAAATHDSVIINAWIDWDNIIYTEFIDEGIRLNIKIDSLCEVNLHRYLKKEEVYFFRKNKGYALNCLAMYYTDKGQYNEAIDNLNKSLHVYEKINFQSGIAAVYINLGRLYLEKSNYQKALPYLKKALKIKREIKDFEGAATACLNIGNVHYNFGNYAEAIRYTTFSLKEFEKINYDIGVAYALNNIGNIYHGQGETEKAIGAYKKSLALRKKMKDWLGMAGSYNNIGLIYQNQRKYKNALKYFDKTIECCKKTGERQVYATALNNIGLVYQEQGDYEKALAYFEESLKIRKDMEEQLGISQSLHNIASNYFARKNYLKAFENARHAFEIADKWKLAVEKRDAAFLLKDIYRLLGKNKDALEMYQIYIAARDSIENEENQKEVIKQEYEYEYAKQSAADSVKTAEEKKVKDAQIAQQDAEIKAKNNQQYMLFGGLGLVVIFAGFMYNRFRVTQKQKRVIEEQKHIVEEKNKEITDSISYAKRIQTAILPPDKIVKECLPDSFILYKPKDIVAGDFYWLETVQSDKERGTSNILFAACDCTGHGVPGAMVSVVCNNGLNRAVREYGLTDPGKILDKTREIVIQEFEKSEEEVKDGMDISLASLALSAENESGERDSLLQHSAFTLKWAGANNPLWLIRSASLGSDEGSVSKTSGKYELIEIKPNKQPIGKYTEPKPFTTHETELIKGDSIYIFTDGFQDQFGGEKGKKFKAAKFKELLLSIQDLSMDQQKIFIDETFESWKSGLEQNDDVCIIGVRI